jgi:DNA-binding CsgD family transcriptional regulator
MSLHFLLPRLSGSLLGCLLAVSLPAQYLFEGVAPVAYHGEEVYLDVLDEWDDFHTISDQMPVRKVAVDSSGYFRLEGTGLPAGKGFCRLRFVQRGTPPVYMHFGHRHFIHFFAEADDTLRFNGLSVIDSGLVHTMINNTAAKLDELATEETHAESVRLLALLDERRKVLLRQGLKEAPVEVAVFLLGNWPKNNPPVEELIALESMLKQRSLRPTYLASLQERIGAMSIGQLRGQNSWLSWLLSASVIGNLVLFFFGWRGRRSKEGAIEEQARNVLTTASLTAKEEEVLQLISAGHSNKEIAGALFISAATVKSHINSIYKKTGADNRKAIQNLGQ